MCQEILSQSGICGLGHRLGWLEAEVFESSIVLCVGVGRVLVTIQNVILQVRARRMSIGELLFISFLNGLNLDGARSWMSSELFGNRAVTKQIPNAAIFLITMPRRQAKLKNFNRTVYSPRET